MFVLIQEVNPIPLGYSNHRAGRDLSGEPRIQAPGSQEIIKTHRKSLLELPVLTF